MSSWSCESRHSEGDCEWHQEHLSRCSKTSLTPSKGDQLQSGRFGHRAQILSEHGQSSFSFGRGVDWGQKKPQKTWRQVPVKTELKDMGGQNGALWETPAQETVQIFWSKQKGMSISMCTSISVVSVSFDFAKNTLLFKSLGSDFFF